jgi:hypothetical protein
MQQIEQIDLEIARLNHPCVKGGAKGAKAGDVQFGPTGKAFRDAIRAGKHDSVIIRNTADEGDIYVALHPHQIKSIFNQKPTKDPRINYTQAFHDAFVERYGFLSTVGAGLQALGQRIGGQPQPAPRPPAPSAPAPPQAARPEIVQAELVRPSPAPTRPKIKMPHVVDDLTVHYTPTPALDHAREVLGALHNPEALHRMADPVADRAAKVSSGHAQRGTARYENEYARHIETARRQVHDDLNKRLPEVLGAADAEHEHHQRLNQLASERHQRLHAHMLRSPEGSPARLHWAARLQESRDNILGHRERLQEAHQEIAGRRGQDGPIGQVGNRLA